jgi:hypothetical protein
LSPILLRPSREQDEHDRLARYLEAKYAKKKLEVFVNVRDEQLMPVKFGSLTRYPDLVLGENKKLAGVVEIETGESVNNLEALAQWVHFGKAKVPFHLYVPANMYEATRRLCDTYHAKVTEIWTYRGAVDGFDLVRMYLDGQAKFPKPSAVLKANPPKPVVVAPPPPPPPPPSPPPVRPQPGAKSGVRKGSIAAAKPGAASSAPVQQGRVAAAPVVKGAASVPRPAASAPPASVKAPAKPAPVPVKAKAAPPAKAKPKAAPKKAKPAKAKAKPAAAKRPAKAPARKSKTKKR